MNMAYREYKEPCPYCDEENGNEEFNGYCSDECEEADFDNRTEAMLDPEF